MVKKLAVKMSQNEGIVTPVVCRDTNLITFLPLK